MERSQRFLQRRASSSVSLSWEEWGSNVTMVVGDAALSISFASWPNEFTGSGDPERTR
jgi:hypothetical protein